MERTPCAPCLSLTRASNVHVHGVAIYPGLNGEQNSEGTRDIVPGNNSCLASSGLSIFILIAVPANFEYLTEIVQCIPPPPPMQFPLHVSIF